jgi:hypothetical protein
MEQERIHRILELEWRFEKIALLLHDKSGKNDELIDDIADLIKDEDERRTFYQLTGTIAPEDHDENAIS